MFGNSKEIYSIITKSIRVWTFIRPDKLNSLPLRLFSNTVIERTQDAHTNNLKWNNNLKSNQKGSIKMIGELLNIRSIMAKDILKCKKFHTISEATIIENYEVCLKNGISKKTLQIVPEVLAESDIPIKILELKRLQYNTNISAPLLSLTYNVLKAFVNEELLSNRIAIISHLLKMKESDVCKTFTRRSFLISLDLNQLSDNVKLLTENGITEDEIINDLWVLRYSTKTIKEKLDLAKKNNIDIFKTWMVRAQPEIFDTYIKRRSDNKLILGDSSLTQYLSERLQCTEELAKYIISKQPALQNKSLKKMNEMIEFLFKYGFKPIHICRVPKILLHSVETTRKRLKELEGKGIQLDSLYILTKSQRQYMHYYESLFKTGKNKSKNT